MNSINALTLIAPEQAREMTVKLAAFFRSSLGKGDKEIHSLKDELRQMKLYLDIEKIRFEERLQVEMKLDEKCGAMTLPTLILQPLYENAIKHGMYGQMGDVKITTGAQCLEGALVISIANTCSPETGGSDGGGIGLSNVNSRLELIYGIPGLAKVEKRADKFVVHLTIPQNQGT